MIVIQFIVQKFALHKDIDCECMMRHKFNGLVIECCRMIQFRLIVQNFSFSLVHRTLFACDGDKKIRTLYCTVILACF